MLNSVRWQLEIASFFCVLIISVRLFDTLPTSFCFLLACYFIYFLQQVDGYFHCFKCCFGSNCVYGILAFLGEAVLNILANLWIYHCKSRWYMVSCLTPSFGLCSIWVGKFVGFMRLGMVSAQRPHSSINFASKSSESFLCLVLSLVRVAM